METYTIYRTTNKVNQKIYIGFTAHWPQRINGHNYACRYENADNKAFYNQITQILIGSDFSPLGRSGTSVFQKDKSVLVDTITLKKFYEDNNLPKNTFLMLDVEGAEYLLFDDIDFFRTYQPKILLSVHLSFLNDENFNYFIESLKKLTDLYEIDIESIYNERKQIQFGSQFRELNYLLTIKK